MKKWNKRILMAICAMCFMLSVFGNIAQHKQILSLQRDVQIQIDRKRKLTEEAETLQAELEKAKEDYEFEVHLKKELQNEYNILADATFEVAKQKAIDMGLDPDELEWFINGKGHWCFWEPPGWNEEA